MRPVFLSHAGLWCAAGATPGQVRQGLRRGQSPWGRLALPQQTVPYAYAAGPALPCLTRLGAALDALGATLDLPGLPRATPLLLGSSSLLIGTLEEGRPEPAGTLTRAVQAHWGLGDRGWLFANACTSSVQALDAAVSLIASGGADQALVVGVELLNRTTPAGFASLQLLSPTGARPLDAGRDGLTLGEGAAAVRITAQPTPWRVHRPCLALDTTSPTGYAEDGTTIAQVFQGALDQAGLLPGAVRAVKLQASGAPGSDAVEARALGRMFGMAPPALFSLKGALGHTLGACGLVELVATLACMEDGWLPPTAGFTRPDPELGLVPTSAPAPWPGGACLFTIQGFGGSLAAWVVDHG